MQEHEYFPGKKNFSNPQNPEGKRYHEKLILRFFPSIEAFRDRVKIMLESKKYAPSTRSFARQVFGDDINKRLSDRDFMIFLEQIKKAVKELQDNSDNSPVFGADEIASMVKDADSLADREEERVGVHPEKYNKK
ncbi:MAG: hypothetical protein PHT51_04920 [Patescibacteria group bacterium]|nr:hypothetical protein [Patescibacteria group bacterium]MDD4610776.1 hypothetical protein [Patescibacteria group bacterium]